MAGSDARSFDDFGNAVLVADIVRGIRRRSHGGPLQQSPRPVFDQTRAAALRAEHLAHRQFGQALRSGVIDDRSVVEVDILESDPDAAHIAARHRIEMDRIRVGSLFGADPEVQGLERHRCASVQIPQQVDHAGGAGNGPDCRTDPPGVLQASRITVADRRAGGIGRRSGLEVQGRRGGHRLVDDGVLDAWIEDQIAVPVEAFGSIAAQFTLSKAFDIRSDQAVQPALSTAGRTGPGRTGMPGRCRGIRRSACAKIQPRLPIGPRR